MVLVQPVDGHDLAGMENEIRHISCPGNGFRLVALGIGDWNHDLSPWPAPAVFGKAGFGDGAAATLKEVLRVCSDPHKEYFIGGYSLAGLFALWAACEVDAFAGVAAASPSLWFPGFTDYLRGHTLRCGAAYLSLGDQEERARNQVMATVGDRVREAHGLLAAQGVDCTLEWNPGNHFKDADLRTARAFSWILGRR